MSSCRERPPVRAAAPAAWAAPRALLLALCAAVGVGVAFPAPPAHAQAPTASSAERYSGIGRTATPQEIAAWDIDVRPDFKGLPKGQGTVARGMQLWEAQCASCHGIFGESNEVFAPIIGGTTKDDVRTGRVARLLDDSFPGRTTMMKLSTLSTLWDYIHRAMPWNAPKSLSVDDTYAVTAFILNLGGVVPDDFTLSHDNMAQVQQWLPNRHGKTTDHAMWPGRTLGGATRKPDVQGQACMQGCAVEARVASLLPEHARNAHGNLAEQNRTFGAQVGADTTRPPGAGTARPAPAMAPLAAAAAPAPSKAAAAVALARQHNCLTCHGLETKVVGPALRDIAARHAGRPDGPAYLLQRIVGGGSGVWGPIPMPPQSLPDTDARALAEWLAQGAKTR